MPTGTWLVWPALMTALVIAFVFYSDTLVSFEGEEPRAPRTRVEWRDDLGMLALLLVPLWVFVLSIRFLP